MSRNINNTKGTSVYQLLQAAPTAYVKYFFYKYSANDIALATQGHFLAARDSKVMTSAVWLPAGREMEYPQWYFLGYQQILNIFITYNKEKSLNCIILIHCTVSDPPYTYESYAFLKEL